MLEPKVERIYQARRAGAVSRLLSAGGPPMRAEAWCARYEAAATVEERSQRAFWTELESWIAAERRPLTAP